MRHGNAGCLVAAAIYQRVGIVDVGRCGWSARNGAVVAPKKLHRDAEKRGNRFHAFFVRRSVASLLGTPLLRGNAKSLGAFFGPAASGEFIHPAIANVSADDFTEGCRYFAHNAFLPCGKSMRHGVRNKKGGAIRAPHQLGPPRPARNGNAMHPQTEVRRHSRIPSCKNLAV